MPCARACCADGSRRREVPHAVRAAQHADPAGLQLLARQRRAWRHLLHERPNDRGLRAGPPGQDPLM
eukprot:4450113-Prymnesium_polylepis.1